ARADRDPGALGDQRRGDRPSESLRASSDHRDAAAESEIHGRTLHPAAAARGPGLQRFDDDYEAARLAAVRARLPPAVEVWAPWGSWWRLMGAGLEGGTVASFAGQFVWLDVDRQFASRASRSRIDRSSATLRVLAGARSAASAASPRALAWRASSRRFAAS